MFGLKRKRNAMELVVKAYPLAQKWSAAIDREIFEAKRAASRGDIPSVRRSKERIERITRHMHRIRGVQARAASQ